MSSVMIYANEQADCCKMMNICEVEGYGVCTECGLVRDVQVIDDNIFTFDNNSDSKYLHSLPSLLYPKSSLGTTISGNSKMSKIHSWGNMPYSERVVWKVQTELKSKLYGFLPDKVITDSVFLYKSIYEKLDTVRGRNKDGVVAACVYFSIKSNSSSMSISRLSEILDVDNVKINKYIKIITPMVEVKNDTKSSDFVSSTCDALKISFDIRKYIVKICKFVDDDGMLDGSIPRNICISVVLFVCREMGIMMDMNSALCKFKVGEGTIRKITGILSKNKQYIFSKIKTSPK